MKFGVDLGTRRIAVVCVDPFFAFSTTLDNTKGKREFPSEQAAGGELGLRASKALYEHGVLGEDHAFYFERPFPFKNVRTAIGQALSAGAMSPFLPGAVHQVENKIWKKELIGNGNVNKAGITAWLQDCHPALAALCEQDQDLVDATCIALWATLAPAG